MTKEQAQTFFDRLRPDAKECLGQLFLFGPTWDGAIVSKTGRGELFEKHFAERVQGWTYLTQTGVEIATQANVKNWNDPRWHKKQSCN